VACADDDRRPRLPQRPGERGHEMISWGAASAQELDYGTDTRVASGQTGRNSGSDPASLRRVHSIRIGKSFHDRRMPWKRPGRPRHEVLTVLDGDAREAQRFLEKRAEIHGDRVSCN